MSSSRASGGGGGGGPLALALSAAASGEEDKDISDHDGDDEGGGGGDEYAGEDGGDYYYYDEDSPGALPPFPPPLPMPPGPPPPPGMMGKGPEAAGESDGLPEKLVSSYSSSRSGSRSNNNNSSVAAAARENFYVSGIFMMSFISATYSPMPCKVFGNENIKAMKKYCLFPGFQSDITAEDTLKGSMLAMMTAGRREQGSTGEGGGGGRQLEAEFCREVAILAEKFESQNRYQIHIRSPC